MSSISAEIAHAWLGAASFSQLQIRRGHVMDRLTLDLRQIDRVNVQKLGFPLNPAAPRRPLGPLERAALKSALSFGKSVNPQLRLPLEAIGVAERRPVVTILPPPTTVGATATSKFPVSISTKTDLTVAVGLVGSFFNVGGASIEGGSTDRARARLESISPSELDSLVTSGAVSAPTIRSSLAPLAIFQGPISVCLRALVPKWAR